MNENIIWESILFALLVLECYAIAVFFMVIT